MLSACLQEVQALAAVGAHPNIVQYYSAWAEPDMQGDQLYIQMELCGDSLAAATRLRDKQPWREPELMGLLKQVGLTAEHNACVQVAACAMVSLCLRRDA